MNFRWIVSTAVDPVGHARENITTDLFHQFLSLSAIAAGGISTQIRRFLQI